MSRAHYRAIEARLGELVLSGKPVPAFLGDPPDNTPLPYAFITPVPVVPHAENLAGTRNILDRYFTVTLAHTSVNNVLALVEKEDELLSGWAPTVPGWRTFPLEPESDDERQPVQTATTAVTPASNTYPRWAVIRYRLQACKEQ